MHQQVAMATHQQKQTVTSSGVINQERRAATSSQSTLTINSNKSVRQEMSIVSSQVFERCRPRCD